MLLKNKTTGNISKFGCPQGHWEGKDENKTWISDWEALTEAETDSYNLIGFKTEKLKEAKEKRVIEQYKNIEYEGISYKTSESSRQKLNHKLNFIDGTITQWADSEGNILDYNRLTLLGLTQQIIARDDSLYKKEEEYKGQINNATTKEELDLIIINFEI